MRRYYGKLINKGTKLRIWLKYFTDVKNWDPNVCTVLKFGSEIWVLKKREEKRLEAAHEIF